MTTRRPGPGHDLTIGAYLLGLSLLPFIYSVFEAYRYGEVVEVDDRWGHGNSLEWATSCTPWRHNVTGWTPNVWSI